MLSNGRRTVFLVSGYIGIKPCVYRVDTSEKSVVLELDSSFGASYGGETKFVNEMMRSVANYENVSPKDAVQLVSIMMDCISILSKFWKSQSVGGDIDIYIMYRDKSVKSGWIRAGQAIPVIPYNYRQVSIL